MRAPSRGLALLVGSLIVWGALAEPASAHALLSRSDPAGGSTLAVAPSKVDLWFSEDVSPGFSTIRLVDAEGGTVAGTRVVPDLDEPRHLVLALPTLGAGAYGVMWQVLAEDEGHQTSGVIVFDVGPGSAAAVGPLPTRTSSSSSPLDVGLRWVRILLLALIVGGLGVLVFVVGRVASTVDERIRRSMVDARRRILTMVVVATSIALAVGVVALMAQARALPRSGPSGALERLLTSTRVGHLWLAREGILAAMVGLAVAMQRRARARAADDGDGILRIVVVGLASALVAIEALGSHAASLNSPYMSAVVVDAIHVLTALLWIGALPVLLLLLWSPGPGVSIRHDLIRALRGSFSRLAAVSVLLLVTSGLFSAGFEVANIRDLVATSYGRLLLVKGVMVLAVLLLGLLNARRLNGWPGPLPRLAGAQGGGGRLTRKLLTAEAGVGVVVLLAAGALASTTPSIALPPQAPPVATRSMYGAVKDVLVSVSVTPNRPGVNGFTLGVTSSRRPPPSPIAGVTITLARGATGSGAMGVPLSAVQPGRYFGSASLAAPGRWRLTAVVRRGGSQLRVPLHWSVAAAPPTTTLDGPRLAPVVDALAVTLLGLAVTVAVVLRIRRRRPRRARWRIGGHRPPIDRPGQAIGREETREAAPR